MVLASGITFDVGGTLIRPWPSVGHVYADEAARMGLSGLCPEDLSRRFGREWGQRPDFDYSQSGWQSLVHATFAGLIPEAVIPELFLALYRRFESETVWEVHPDVRPALAALHDKGLRLGVISNWDDRLRPLLSRLDLDCYFDPIIVSREVGLHKPNAKIFGMVAQAWGMPASDIIHVGDQVAADIEGARNAGFRALLVDREKAPAKRGELRDLRQLIEILDRDEDRNTP